MLSVPRSVTQKYHEAMETARNPNKSDVPPSLNILDIARTNNLNKIQRTPAESPSLELTDDKKEVTHAMVTPAMKRILNKLFGQNE